MTYLPLWESRINYLHVIKLRNNLHSSSFLFSISKRIAQISSHSLGPNQLIFRTLCFSTLETFATSVNQYGTFNLTNNLNTWNNLIHLAIANPKDCHFKAHDQRRDARLYLKGRHTFKLEGP